MKKSLFYFFTSVFLFSQFIVSAQSQVSVNPLTGTGNVVIPVYTISSGQVSLPISLVYNATGVKPKDVESSAGMNWTLQAGGQISRQLRGLPDDVTQDNSGISSLGWLSSSNTAPAKINAFSIANDNNTATCSDEITDINYINANFNYTTDTEPDVFNVNAPGLSCQFIFDGNHQIRLLSYQDLKITYTQNSGTGNLGGAITSFTIINDKGITYTFASPDKITQTTVLPTGSTTPPVYLKTTYYQYQHGIDFYDNWHLTSIKDANGNAITLGYGGGTPRGSTDPVTLYIAGSTTGSVQYLTQQTINLQTVYSISGGGDNLALSWDTYVIGNGGTNIPYVTNITGAGRNFKFDYSPVVFIKQDNTGYYRNFLRDFKDIGCNSPVNYKFSYYGETNSTGNIFNYQTTLPDSSTNRYDYWGYYNTNNSTSPIPFVYVNPANTAYPRYTNYTYPNAAGPDYTNFVGVTGKYVDPTTITTGSLATIINAQGGTTTLTYEPNDYLDIPSNTISYGNGIRVKKITDNDGISTAHDMVRNYGYLNPVTGKSSGKAVTLPVFAFTIPYTGTATGNTLWNNATAISITDLSNDDHTVMYGYVKESRTGAGSTLYQYYVPATEWDNSAIPGCGSCTTAEWSPTITNMARPTCASYGPIKNDIYTYPFPPAANYDMERGLIQKVINYNETGTEVSETNYAYQRTGAPLTVTAFKFDDNNGVKAYAKYNIYAATSELISTQTQKVFDSPTLSQARQSSVSYTYAGTGHKLPTQTQVTNSDNSILTTQIKYTKDYATATSGGDAPTAAIYHLQQLNINTPVETYQQVQRGGITNTISGALTKFGTFTSGANTFYLPAQSLKLIAPDGITNFQPSTIASGIFSWDNRYFAAANYTAYDGAGVLQTADDAHQHVNGVIATYGTHQPLVTIKNAAAAEVSFNDFDNAFDNSHAFTVAGNPDGGFSPNGSHSAKSIGLGTSQWLNAQTSKNVQANNYVFSVWLNTAAAGNVVIALTTTGSQTYTYTEPVAGNNTWTYYEWKIPVNNMTPSFTTKVSCSVNVSVDDVLFYPENATVNTMNYDVTTHYKIAATNTNGVSVYYSNDQWGRTLYSFDQDRNILQKNLYILSTDIQNFSSAFTVSTTGNIYNTTPVVFTNSAVDGCYGSGVNYQWNFGDGTAPFNTTQAGTVTHTYSALVSTATNYTVTLTVSSPYYGQKTTTQTVTVLPPPPVNLTYSTNTTGGGISSVTLSNSSNTYTFNTGQLNGASIAAGTYNVTIYTVGGLYNPDTGKGWKYVGYIDQNNTSNGGCFTYSSAGNSTGYSFSFNFIAGHTINFKTDNTSCTYGQ